MVYEGGKGVTLSGQVDLAVRLRAWCWSRCSCSADVLLATTTLYVIVPFDLLHHKLAG